MRTSNAEAEMGITYGHWRQASLEAATVPLVGAESSFERALSLCGQLDRGILGYSDALQGHRGCRECWLRWEAHAAVKAATEAGQPFDSPLVKCPICDLFVDIRQSYDETLCKGCQHQVVASGFSWELLWARIQQHCSKAQKLLGGCLLCIILGLQALISCAIWFLCKAQLEESAAIKPGYAPLFGQIVSNHSASTSDSWNYTRSNLVGIYGPLVSDFFR